ncbi:unnamed protein product [Dracunculus medinensis]|uniref:MITF_TFEB_C_3_N domain-containing protein n=1 Tax=Dracunculus medinensis TaxID=318479 RepID=A0A158Q5G6_DRAME|nr:unnamed protein product [Dracunculus medinensis]
MSVTPNIAPQHMQRQQRYGITMMQPNQQPVQVAPGQYISNAPVQPRTLSDALARLPPDLQQIAQQQINTETNAERRKQIALSYIQNHRMRVSQGYQTQNSMGAQGMIVNMNTNQQIPQNSSKFFSFINMKTFFNPMNNGSMTRMGNSNISQPAYPSQVPQMASNQMPMQLFYLFYCFPFALAERLRHLTFSIFPFWCHKFHPYL